MTQAQGYVDYNSQCSPVGTVIGPEPLNGCGGDLSAPVDCSSSDGRKDKPGCIGDPVNLRTGALSIDPVDLDLGGLLRFARHYSSDALVFAPPASETLPNVGYKWSHSLYWNVVRTVASGVPTVVVVTEPMRPPVPYLFDGTKYKPAAGGGGTVTVDPDFDVHFTNAAGTQTDFNFNTADSKYYLTQIRVPGELPINVSAGPGAGETTFARGTQSIVLKKFTSGADVGKLSRVTANGEQWDFTYVGGILKTVQGPDPSTPSTTDKTTWTYTYKSTTPAGRLVLLERNTTANPTNVTLGTWDYGPSNRVITADEQALEQPLTISYSTPPGLLQATVRNASSQLLAVFESKYNANTVSDPVTATTGVITQVTNATGPVTPVPGGPGVDVPFVAQTTVGPKNPLVKTRTDKRGNKTLFENYDNQSRPGREVNGWVDGPSQPGVFSADDTYASLEETVWHPVLQKPLIEYTPSVLPGGGTRTTIYDYDDPATPGDNPTVPNQAPTQKLFSGTEQGYTLDASGNVVLAAYKTTFTYDAAGHIKTVNGPRPENFTEHFYDATTGYKTSTRRYLNGPSSSYLETVFSNFDSLGNPQTVTDPNLQATQFTYDTKSRIKTVTPPFSGGSSTISFTYDVDGNLTRIDFPPDSFAQAYFLRLGYDTKNRLTFLADAAGNAIVYERTGGRVTREALYSGFVSLASRGTLTGDSTFSYDAAGRMLKAFNPLFAGNTVFTQYGPDANGNPTSITDENGKQDTRIYDALDRLKQVSQVRGATTYVTQFDYDLQGRMKRITDPATKATDYQHDDFGRLVKVTSPNTGVTLYTYDAAGNLVAKKENFTGSSRTTGYSYDGLDRLTLVDFPTDADWVFPYDASTALNQMGRLSSVSNGIVTTSREYTARGDLAREGTTIGGTTYFVTYGYDAGGNRTSVQAPSGVTAAYAYSGGRAKTLTVTAGFDQQVVRNIAFAPFGGRTRAEFPPFNSGTGLNTVISTRSYNLRGQAATIQVTSPAGTVLDQSFEYAYTAGGAGPVDAGPNLDRVIDNRDANESRFYFYDDLDRLWKSSSLAGAAIYTYTYDANGNRIGEIAPGLAQTTSYEAGTDLLAQSTGTVPRYYKHDVYGNRIWAGPSAYAGLPSAVFNQRNQLVEARDPVTQAVIGLYTYDVFGRRVRKINAGGTTLFFYGSTGGLIEERSLATSPNSVRSYAWIEDEAVGVVDSGAQPTKFSWIHADRLGTPLAVTSSPSVGGAQTIWRASYGPFGSVTTNQDPDGDSQQFVLDMRFPGQLWDAETGLHYNWHRYYDPSIGRYVSADPLGQLSEFNLYSYAQDDPTRFIDPTGEWGIAGAVLGAVSGGVGAAITSGGDPTSIIAGAGVGAFVGFLIPNPMASNSIGAAIGSAGASALGQVVGNFLTGKSPGCNFSFGAVAGSAVGGGGSAYAGVAAQFGRETAKLVGRGAIGRVAGLVAEGAHEGVITAGTESIGAAAAPGNNCGCQTGQSISR
ncbi:MAG: RHS repeat-associated core domain-containing protein [Myxococcota bacterium]